MTRRLIQESNEPESECPMSRGVGNDEMRQNPANREIAYAFQFHDTARNAFQMAHVGPTQFDDVLKILEAQIASYRRGA